MLKRWDLSSIMKENHAEPLAAVFTPSFRISLRLFQYLSIERIHYEQDLARIHTPLFAKNSSSFQFVAMPSIS